MERAPAADTQPIYLLTIAVYALPAVFIPLGVGGRYVVANLVFIPLGAGAFWYVAKEEYEPLPAPDPDMIDPSSEDAVIATYSELGEAFRYRDRLLLQATYFSFAILAVLINIFFRVNPSFRPAIALIGSILGFGFAVSITSQRRTRDQIREARSILSGLAPLDDVVTTSDVGTIRRRPVFSNFSAGTYIENVHVVIFIGWLLTYVWVSFNAATGFEVLPVFDFLR